MKGPLEKGQLFAVLEYMKGGQVVTHPCDPENRVLHPIHIPLPGATCVSVVVCVARKPRPCPCYSRRRDRINLGLLRSYYRGGGGTVFQYTGVPRFLLSPKTQIMS